MEGFVRRFVTILVFVSNSRTAWTQDPCAISVPDVPDLTKRGLNTPNIGLDDDSFDGTWVSGTVNYDMIQTDLPAEDHPIDKCGSQYPAMIVDQNFTMPDTGVQEAALVRYYDKTAMEWLTMDIQVKNCGSYRVYQLTSLPMGTYCFATNAEADLCVRDDIPEFEDILERRPSNDGDYLDDSTLQPGWLKSSLLDISQAFQVVDPDFHHCGGAQPIFAQSPLPSNDGAVHDMDLAIYNISGGDPDTVTVQVRNCGEFRLYNLSSMVPAKSSYCFDFPHETDEPALWIEISSEVIEVTVCTNTNEEPMTGFLCELKPEESLNETHFYLITWYVSGVPLSIQRNINAFEKAILKQEDLANAGYYRMVNLSCGVAVRSTENGIVGKVKLSEELFFGIQLTETEVVISPGSRLGFEIIMNTLLPCDCSEEFCMVKLSGYDPMVNMDESPNTATQMSFIVSMSEGDGLDGMQIEGAGHVTQRKRRQTAGKFTRFTIDFQHMFPYVTKDRIDRNRMPVVMRMDTNKSPLFPGGIYGGVDVKVWEEPDKEHWRKKSCHAVCDPHMKTFDGRSYELQNEGEFVLYKFCPSTTVPHWYPRNNVKIEVHMKTIACGENGAKPFCPCGLAVTAGHDVYVLDTCSDVRQQGFTRCEDNILRVEETDSVVKVWFPHGTRVEARRVKVSDGVTLWNIWVYPSIHDIECTCGLCGSLDDNCGNDCDVFNGKVFYSPYGTDCDTRSTPLMFTEQHQIPETQSLFMPLEYGNIAYINPTEYRPNSPSFCHCRHGFRTTPDDCFCQQTQYWGDDQDMECDVYEEIPPNPFAVVTNDGFRLGGITETEDTVQATEADCDEMFNDLKAKYPTCDVFDTEILENCKMDIEFNAENGFGWILNTKEILETECKTDNAMKSNPDPVIEAICIGGCGDHGDCGNGECECHDGYGGSRCDVNRHDKIELLPGENNICDNRYKECKRFTIAPKTKSFVKEFSYFAKIGVNRRTPSGHKQTLTTGKKHECTFKNFMCLTLDMPLVHEKFSRFTRSIDNVLEMSNERAERQADDSEVEGVPAFVLEYEVTISSDNVTDSNTLSFFSRDGTCVGASEDENGFPTFFIKPLFCFLDFECVPNGTFHITDKCRYCDTDKNPIDWIIDTDNPDCLEVTTPHPAPVERSLSIAVIASSSTAVFVVLIAGAIFILYRIYRKTLPKNATFAEIGHTLGQNNPHFKPREFLPEKKHII
ncbi:uncharacterized protein [Argopecten irradians]|uniref:uncharacterized protein n=1 Tax=Argopecten irradians TaxID=31199 RepID=UPI003714A3E4